MRGRFGTPPMDAKTLTYLCKAVSIFFQQKNQKKEKPLFLVARDTRESGKDIESIITSTFEPFKFDIRFLGVFPTPGLVHEICNQSAMGGVMVSASHNPAHDNGIKLFKTKGEKLSSADEQSILKIFHNVSSQHIAPPSQKMEKKKGSDTSYAQHLHHIFKDLCLQGLHIVADCAHGAMCEIAPRIFKGFGARVTAIGTCPDGHNINDGCGSTYPSLLQRKTKELQADFGVAFDGDGDRLLFCKGDGTLLDGDQLLVFLALASPKLTPPIVVSTIMANAAMEEKLLAHKIKLKRTPVGDKAVAQAMQETGALLGGEASGHLIIKPHSTTGDGLFAALTVLRTLRNKNAPQLPCFKPYPQHIENISIKDIRNEKEIFTDHTQKKLQACIKKGRLFIRSSGTEPVLRLTIEAPSKKMVEQALQRALPLILS